MPSSKLLSAQTGSLSMPMFYLVLVFFVGVLLLGLGSCQRQLLPVNPAEGFDWQGHRGARGLLPENSVPAFLKALEYPEVTTLELDLAVSADKKLIVSHEPWFNPAICSTADGDTTANAESNPSFWLYKLTAEEIRAFDCGSRGNARFPEQKAMSTHKPMLAEVVEAVRAAHPNRLIRYNIEIKSQPAWDEKYTPNVEEFVALVLAELKRLGIAEVSTVQSFDLRPLQELHRIAPQQTVALLVENPLGLGRNLDKLGFLPHIYSPYYVFVKKSTVRKCHRKGIKIIPWTVNEVGVMRRLIRKGVDGIITDYPNRIEQVSKKGN